MLERSHLTILVEVSRRGSLTAAAEALCLTQSALSHAIKKLERQLGTPVWIKDGRKLRLTEAGRYLLSMANRLLPQFEHAEHVVRQIAEGRRGTLRIGIECHPCYDWLLSIVSPYLQEWRDVDVDVKQQFQFGGVGALFNHEIDVLVTPDPLNKASLMFVPVFDYEQVLVVNKENRLAARTYVSPDDLADETLITYPVDENRLDIFSQFLLPAKVVPKKHKTIETTDMLFQMVAAGRGVTASPLWLMERYADNLPLASVRLGRRGISKQIFIGIRKVNENIDYVNAFMQMARTKGGLA